MPNSLSILGAGRVGRALGRRLRELGWRIGVVVTRSEASARRAARFIGAGKPHAGMTRQILVSRVILIAVPDHEIASVAHELARTGAEELR
jgi:predicted dinucleotide-binding enzyme